MNESIKVILKQKSIPVLVDFCLEEKIEFSVKPQSFPDTDWEFLLMVKEIKTAVLTGMFLRENRIDITGSDAQKPAKKPLAKKPREEDEKPASIESKTDEKEDKGLF